MKPKTPWTMPTLPWSWLGGQLVVTALFCVVLFNVPSVTIRAGSEGKRPNKHPNFSDGFREFSQQNWKEAVDSMAAALDDWQEDGELTRVYGRWFEPYLPRYYLGAALLELGCYRAAKRQLDQTILNFKEVKGAKKQKQQLEPLKLESEEFLRRGIEAEDAECEKWNSWSDSD